MIQRCIIHDQALRAMCSNLAIVRDYGLELAETRECLGRMQTRQELQVGGSFVGIGNEMLIVCLRLSLWKGRLRGCVG